VIDEPVWQVFVSTCRDPQAWTLDDSFRLIADIVKNEAPGLERLLVPVDNL
jgi:hypothetical protein